MIYRLVLVLTVLTLVLASLFMLAFAHGEMPKVIIIDKVQSKKPPVTLSHDKHGDTFGCQACHHAAKDDAKPQSCFNCHGKDPDIPDPSVSSAKENPFHITCRGCHKEKGEGPTKCGDCHQE